MYNNKKIIIRYINNIMYNINISNNMYNKNRKLSTESKVVKSYDLNLFATQ